MKISGLPIFSAIAPAKKPAEGALAAVVNGPAQASFQDVLGGMLKDVDGALHASEKLSIGSLSGSVPIQKAVDAVIQAEQKVQMTVAVRDKIVAAYLELTRMPI